jgi:hypothetical protein
MTDAKNDDLATTIDDLIPKSLNDIIRINRDQARLYLTTDDEIMDLYAEVTPGTPKEVIDDWRLISLYFVPSNLVQVMLLGDRRCNPPRGLPAGRGHARITSVVRRIDLDRGFVVTNSRSLYQLGKKGHGQPPFEHLAMICQAFHSWGFGMFLGTPYFLVGC